jgi:DNA cross-link repair 1A protein
LPAEPRDDLSMSQMLEIDLQESSQILSESDIKPNDDVQLQCISTRLQDFDPSRNLFESLMSQIYAPQNHEIQAINMEKNPVSVVSDDSESDNDKTEEKSTKKRRKKVVCPAYKVIEGSYFAVDAFRYGEISYVEHYFLTHYHADHYIGLRKKFNHKIYLSKITALLVRQFIGVAEELLQIVQVNVPFYVENVKITPMDANHCPGALLFLFEFPDGRNVLHTGDFRANEQMIEQLKIWNIKLDLVYLDTTYLHTKRRMPSQEDSIKFLLEHVQTYLEKNIGEKFLIVVGAYLIGKEKVWMSIAKKFNFKVYLEKERLRSFKEICSVSLEHFEVYKNHVTEDIEEADIRVVNMIQLSYPNLRDFLNDNQDTFNTILGIVASGWENQKYSPGRISLLHVQYSEHSSYSELENFIVKTSPKRVISTVPIRMNSAVTSDVPRQWLTDEKKTQKKFKQKKIK